MSLYRTEQRQIQTLVEVRVIDCATCGKTADLPTRSDAPPVGWLTLYEQTRADWTTPTAYCSKACLVRGNSGQTEDEQMTALGRTAFASVQA